MVNFGPLAAEIVSLVWGTSSNFNGFRFLAALLHSQTAALNRRVSNVWEIFALTHTSRGMAHAQWLQTHYQWMVAI